ncbi:MAG: NAD(P)H-hydrate dehydratase [Polymorphobacter sp.]|uniref:NAD(P)H-hydrate dehydratase n=1 Tax=Polymorphobacter sp. TaxID=1909290 RepID=UPI003A840ED8
MLSLPPGIKVLTAAAMRDAEAEAMAGGVSALALMERAAAAAVAAILVHCPAPRALVLCGPGNNGGDGYGIAAGLRARGVDVEVAAYGKPGKGAAAIMAERWGRPALDLADARPAPLIVDALFGTGLARSLPTEIETVLARLAGHGQVVAIDIASGIDADHGTALSPPLVPNLTVTFGAAKRGHVQSDGAQAVGRLVVADIGLPPISSEVSLGCRPLLRPLPGDVHKYARGHVLVIENDDPHGGAARLSALAALKSGAGLVTLVGPANPPAALALMQRDDDEAERLLLDPRTSVIVLGPGLPDTPRTQAWLFRLLPDEIPLVLDAGALSQVTPQTLSEAAAPLVLTPHEGEFVRLFGPIEGDRIDAVLAASKAAGAIVLLKGPQTIVAAPWGEVRVNTHASPYLASAGSGDVLAGLVAGLIAQGLNGFDAAVIAAWLHGEAGQRGGPGLIADDLPALMPAILKSL